MTAKKASHAKNPRGKNRDISVYFLAFFVPVLICLAAFIVKKIYPFGDNMFLQTDLYHQYAPFAAEFLNKLKEGGSLFYSWNIGGGQNFIAIYAYYLADPFNWLLFFVPRSTLIEFITYMVAFKIGLCGLTFSVFLCAHTQKFTKLAAPFSWAYALSAFIVAYSWNIMWIDSIILAPLVLLGIDRLVRKKKPLFYCFMLGLTVLVNFYIAIMVCIFTALYFVCQLVILPAPHRKKITADEQQPAEIEAAEDKEREDKERPEYAKKILLFIVFSAIGAGLSAVLLLPAYMALKLSSSANSVFPSTWTFYFNIFEVLARHSAMVTTEQALDHWPNIYSGSAVFLLIPMYFLNRNIRLKEKLVYTALLAFMLISFSTNVLNYIWHGFHYPNSLPARQSFLYIAVILLLCYKGALNLKRITKSGVAISAAIGLGFLAAVFFLIEIDETPKIAVIVTAGFLIFFLFILAGVKWRLMRKSVALTLSCLVISVELFSNFVITGIREVSRSSYIAGDEAIENLLETAESESDSLFYRVDKDEITRLTRNDGAMLNYRSISIFSSISYDAVGTFYRKYGSDHSANAYSTNGMTEYMQALFGVRYRVSKHTNLDQSLIYEDTASKDGYYLYTNSYAQSLGFMVSDSAREAMNDIAGDTPFDRQSALLYAITGLERAFFTVPNSMIYSKGSWFTDRAGLVYCYVTDTQTDEVTCYIGERTKTFTNVDRMFLLDLGWVEKDTLISLADSDGEPVDAVVKIINESVYTRMMEEISDESFIVEELTDTHVSGTVTANEDGYLVVTIPYDPGWSVTVDGEEISAEQLAENTFEDSWYTLKLDAGTHTVTFDYSASGFKEGAVISLVSVLILLIISLVLYLIQRNKKRYPEVES